VAVSSAVLMSLSLVVRRDQTTWLFLRLTRIDADAARRTHENLNSD
jgi:hypothetical protein